MIKDQDNTVQKQAENWDSDEEISWNEIVGYFLAELVPGRGRFVTCLVIMVSLLIITLVFWGSFGWHFYKEGPTRSGQKMNLLTAQKIRLVYRLEDGTLSSETPPWIYENLSATIYKKLVDHNLMIKNQEELSIYDEELNTNVQSVIREVYWIQKVDRIRKFYPTFLEIEVTYRSPAMLVVFSEMSEKTEGAEESEESEASEGDEASEASEGSEGSEGSEESEESLSDGNSQNLKRSWYYIPLSSDYRILPMFKKNFPVPKEERINFPKFCGEAPEAFYESDELLDVTDFPGCEPPLSQTRIPGTIWTNDTQIVDAMKIVNLLGDRWKKFGLYYICVEKNANSPDKEYSKKPFFCLVTKNGSRIHWGECVEKALSKGDILDEDKVVALDKEFEKKGYLDTEKKQFIFSFEQSTNQERSVTLESATMR